MSTLPAGTITFLFTDIEGSTRLWQQHADAMQNALAQHHAILQRTIESHNGRVFQQIGDGFCAAFATAAHALEAAVSAQKALQRENWTGIPPVRVRMGLHTGAVELMDGEYRGYLTLARTQRIMSAGHGGQILLSQAVHDLVRDEMPPGFSVLDLGEHRLKDLVRLERIFQIHIPELPEAFPPLSTLDTLPNNLPIQTTSFIGRERDIAEIRRLLSAARLVTLTGVGGTGKTRLSLHVAADLLDRFGDGAWLVEFAPITDPALVPQAVASVLGVHEEPGQPLTSTLAAWLQAKHLLLVLDNCEHMITACAQLAEVILQKCPHVALLASSREPLAIPGEMVWSVPSLAVPDPKMISSQAVATNYDAVRLFVDRALAVQQTFKLTSTNARSVAQICYRLDGIPLAIELAAARVRALPVEQIAARLDDRFRLLTGGSRTALPRHRTLQATIDWSYELLSDGERRLLRQLGVFMGGWTLKAAESICLRSAAPDGEVIDLLTHLVEKSLVLLDEQGTDSHGERYRMLETIRHYALDKLLHSDETEQVRSQHFMFYLRLAEQAESRLSGAEQVRWLEWLELEHDNIRTALDWAYAASQLELALRLAGALRRFWELRNYASEGRERMAAILSMAAEAAPTIAYGRALAGAGQLAYRQSDYPVSQSYYEQALGVCRQLNDKVGEAYALNGLGNIATEVGDYETAPRLFAESLALGRELKDTRRVAVALTNLGWAALRPGDYSRAEKYLSEALGVCQDMKDKVGSAMALSGLGEVALRQGDFVRATRLLEKSLALRRELGIKWGIAVSLGSLGWIALRQRDFQRARTLLGESLMLRLEVGDKGGLAWCLERLAELAKADMQLSRAVKVFAAASALRARMGSIIDPVDQPEYEHNIADLKNALSDQFDALWEDGRALSLDETVACALDHEQSHA